MTMLSKLIQFDIRPKRKPNKSIYLNKEEKLIKKDLAGMLGISSFKGYKNWNFEYNNNGNMVEYDNVNKFIKDLCAGKIPTDDSYYITAQLSFDRSGECYVMDYIDLQCLITDGCKI